MKADDMMNPLHEGDDFRSEGISVRDHLGTEMAKAIVSGMDYMNSAVSDGSITKSAFELADALIRESQFQKSNDAK